MVLTAEYTMLALNFRWLRGGHETNAKSICTPLFTVRVKIIWIPGFKTQDLFNKDMAGERLEQKSAKYKQHT